HDEPSSQTHTLSLPDALPISPTGRWHRASRLRLVSCSATKGAKGPQSSHERGDADWAAIRSRFSAFFGIAEERGSIDEGSPANKRGWAMNQVCPECGARLAERAERCDLCGTFVGSGSATPPAIDRRIDPPEAHSEEIVGLAGRESGVFCNQCGWKNPPGSRFCSRCGSRLQDSSALAIDPPVKQAARPKSSNG